MTASTNPDSQPPNQGELIAVVEHEGMLVAGDENAVEAFLTKLRFNTEGALDVVGGDAQSVTGAAALASGLAAIGAQHGTFVRLDPKSVEMLAKFRVIPGDPGFNRMTLTDAAGKFRGQMQWQQASLAGTRAISIQLTIATMALQTAIAETTKAVERVEGKVEAILSLVNASMIGDVLGHHQYLQRTVRTLDETGALPETDWDAVAPLGPTLEVVVERLRAHIRKSIDRFDASLPVQDRAEILHRLMEHNKLGESLELLAVAEQSLYLWQRLRIERVRQSESDHLELAVTSARRMLADHLTADGELLLKARTELAAYAAIKPLEIVRWMSTAQLKTDMLQLREDLDSFAAARRAEVQGWQDQEDPTIGDALEELGRNFKAIGGTARAIGSRGLDAGAAGLGFLGKRIKQATQRTPELQDIDPPGHQAE
ncbi:hypothetical protein [Rhodococcus ruber]|uniref:hypothetical protein n=1 Tax=Rhodococcus ruber TaxID=1830 RepID=UPI00315D5F20